MTKRKSKKEIKFAAEKPPFCKVNLKLIPEVLKRLPRWVFWKWERKRRKDGVYEWTKIPYSPGTERRAKPNDPSTWGTWQQIINKPPRQRRQFDGIGFFFHEDDGFTGVDLDDAIDLETGELKLWAQAKVEKLLSYTETSPTQTGVKIVARGRKPSDARCKGPFADGEIEMYHKARFFCLTGQRWPGTPEGIEERCEQIAEVYHEVFGKPSMPVKREGQARRHLAGSPEQPQEHPSQPGAEGVRPETGAPDTLTDDEAIERAAGAKNGDKFRRLMEGDTSDYGDDASRADLALASILAFWTDKDVAQMDRIFRRSKLMTALSVTSSLSGCQVEQAFGGRGDFPLRHSRP